MKLSITQPHKQQPIKIDDIMMICEVKCYIKACYYTHFKISSCTFSVQLRIFRVVVWFYIAFSDVYPVYTHNIAAIYV